MITIFESAKITRAIMKGGDTMKDKLNVQVIGRVVLVATFAVGMLGDWVRKRELDELVEQKVNEALGKEED